MDSYGRPPTTVKCPRCKGELLGNGLNCAKCGPILRYLGQGYERASAFDFTADFLPLRFTFYAIMMVALLMIDDWLIYTPALGLAMVIDPWRSVHQRVSFARGLRYLIAATVFIGGAFTLGLHWQELLDYDYASASPVFAPAYAREVLVMFAHCLGAAGIMMWVGALVLSRR